MERRIKARILLPFLSYHPYQEGNESLEYLPSVYYHLPYGLEGIGSVLGKELLYI